MAGVGSPPGASERAAAPAAALTMGHSSVSSSRTAADPAWLAVPAPAAGQAGMAPAAVAQDQTAHGTQPSASSSAGRPSRTAPEPSGQYRAAHRPSGSWVRCRNRSICSESPSWSVSASATATQLESRGHE